MIRAIHPNDTRTLVEVTIRSGLFQHSDSPAVQAMFDEFHANRAVHGHQILCLEAGGEIQGLVYFAPREFAEGVWEVLMIAIEGRLQRRGLGGELLLAVERHARTERGRLLLVETSSRPDFDSTRSFYRKHGYRMVAEVPDYYADGDGKITFIKRLAEAG